MSKNTLANINDFVQKWNSIIHKFLHFYLLPFSPARAGSPRRFDFYLSPGRYFFSRQGGIFALLRLFPFSPARAGSPLRFDFFLSLRRSFFLFPFSFFLLFSCTTQRQLTYLQDIDQAGKDKYFQFARPEYRLQKQDILYIRFTSSNQDINNSLNAGIGAAGQIMTGGLGYLSGYTIDDSGIINLPVLGKIEFLGKTMEEIRKSIEKRVSEYFNDVTVMVRLLSYKVTILGEVKTPGTYQNYNDQLTVLEALGMAGDLTEYGNRSTILVLRPSKDGTKFYRFNLKNKDLLGSEAYYLLPNDVVIVEPRRIKLISWNAPTVSLFFSTLFSTISLTLLIIKIR